MYVSAKRESSAHSSTCVKSPQEVHPACDPVSKGNAILTELINSKWETIRWTERCCCGSCCGSWSEGDGVTYSEVEDTPVRHCEYDQIWINSSILCFCRPEMVAHWFTIKTRRRSKWIDLTDDNVRLCICAFSPASAYLTGGTRTTDMSSMSPMWSHSSRSAGIQFVSGQQQQQEEEEEKE